MRALTSISKVYLLSIPMIATLLSCQNPFSSSSKDSSNGSSVNIAHPLTGIWAMVPSNTNTFKAFDWFTVPSMRGYLDTLIFYTHSGTDVPSNSKPMPLWVKLNWMRIGTPLSDEDFFTGTYPGSDVFNDHNLQPDASLAKPTSRTTAYWDAYSLTNPEWPYLFGTCWAIDASANYSAFGSKGNLEIWHYPQGTTPKTLSDFYNGGVYKAWCDSMSRYRTHYDTLYDQCSSESISSHECFYLYDYLRSQKLPDGEDAAYTRGWGQEAALIQHGILVKDGYQYEVKDGSDTLKISNASGDTIRYKRLKEAEIPSQWMTLISQVSVIDSLASHR